ncbi:MAG: hypothetical protein AAGH88_06780 [Planctomycetota bacterium]
MLYSNRLVAACLVALFCSTSALAQFGPPRTDPNPQPNPQPEPRPIPGPNPNPDPRPTPQPDPNAPVPDIRLPGNNPNVSQARPEWLKPGAQVTYAVTDSYNPNPNPNLPPNQQPKPSAGMGYREYTVIAVTEEKVYLQQTLYLAPQGLPLKDDGSVDMTIDPKAQATAMSYKVVTGMEVNQGDAIWMPPARLQAMEQKRESSADGTQGSWIDPTSWPVQGQLVNAVKIELWGANFARNRVYRRDTGMLLFHHDATGGVKPGTARNNIYAKEIVDIRQLVHYEQIDSPMIGGGFPAWTQQVKAMHYTGQQAFVMQGAPPVSLPMSITMTVEQNDGQIMLGKALMKQQGSADQSTDVVMGPGSLFGYWVDPRALSQLRPGEIHRNDATRTFITYQVQEGPLGRLGVFVHSNEAKSFFAVNGYDLQDGKLMYMQFAQPEQNLVREFQLQNVERR